MDIPNAGLSNNKPILKVFHLVLAFFVSLSSAEFPISQKLNFIIEFISILSYPCYLDMHTYCDHINPVSTGKKHISGCLPFLNPEANHFRARNRKKGRWDLLEPELFKTSTVFKCFIPNCTITKIKFLSSHIQQKPDILKSFLSIHFFLYSYDHS